MPDPTMNPQQSSTSLWIVASELMELLTCAVVIHRPAIADTWYSLSYLYYSAVGCLGCIAAGIIISFVTGWLSGFLSLGPRRHGLASCIGGQGGCLTGVILDPLQEALLPRQVPTLSKLIMQSHPLDYHVSYYNIHLKISPIYYGEKK